MEAEVNVFYPELRQHDSSFDLLTKVRRLQVRDGVAAVFSCMACALKTPFPLAAFVGRSVASGTENKNWDLDEFGTLDEGCKVE